MCELDFCTIRIINVFLKKGKLLYTGTFCLVIFFCDYIVSYIIHVTDSYTEDDRKVKLDMNTALILHQCWINTQTERKLHKEKTSFNLADFEPLTKTKAAEKVTGECYFS